MLNYVLRRLGYMAITLLIVAILGYIIIELPPGSYVEAEVARLRAQGGNLTQGQIDSLYRRYGLDKPEIRTFLALDQQFCSVVILARRLLTICPLEN